MKKKDLEKYKNRYNRNYDKFGLDSKSLGWGGGRDRQFKRYEGMLRNISKLEDFSIIDVGCGFGDLYDFLEKNGYDVISYLGIDINDNFIEECKNKYSNSIQFIESDSIPKENSADIVFACGIFNAKIDEQDNYDYIKESLESFLTSANKYVIVDFLSPFVDYKQELSFHPDLDLLIPIIKELGYPFEVIFNYLPYEFSIKINKDVG